MFSLNGAVKYKYIPSYQDMLGGYDKLCGIMERKLYQDQIKELIQTVKTLLDANVTLGVKQKEAEAKAQKSDARIAELQAQVDKLNGELQAPHCKIHGKNSEKKSGAKSGDKGKTAGRM